MPLLQPQMQCRPTSGSAATLAEVERGKHRRPQGSRGGAGEGRAMRGFVGFGVTSAVTLLAMVQLPANFDGLAHR